MVNCEWRIGNKEVYGDRTGKISVGEKDLVFQSEDLILFCRPMLKTGKYNFKSMFL